jgi:hypothetical protein
MPIIPALVPIPNGSIELVVQVNKRREWKRPASVSVDRDQLLHLEATHMKLAFA